MKNCILPKKPTRRKSRNALVKATGINPKDLHCLHLCENDSYHGGCINPEHLYWGTKSQNMKDLFGSDRGEEARRKISEGQLGKKRGPYRPRFKERNTTATEHA